MSADGKKRVRPLWAYLVWLMAMIVLWAWVYGLLTKVGPEEKVSIFLGTHSASFAYTEQLNDNRPAYLREVEVRAFSLDDAVFPLFFSVFGYPAADVLILPESEVDGALCENYFSPLSEDFQAGLPGLGFYEADGAVYGVKVHDRETGESLVKGLDFGGGEEEDDFYLFFGKNSLHVGNLSGEGTQNQQEGALTLARMLMSL